MTLTDLFPRGATELQKEAMDAYQRRLTAFEMDSGHTANLRGLIRDINKYIFSSEIKDADRFILIRDTYPPMMATYISGKVPSIYLYFVIYDSQQDTVIDCTTKLDDCTDLEQKMVAHYKNASALIARHLISFP